MRPVPGSIVNDRAPPPGSSAYDATFRPGSVAGASGGSQTVVPPASFSSRKRSYDSSPKSSRWW